MSVTIGTVTVPGPQYNDILRDIKSYVVTTSLGGDGLSNPAGRPKLHTIEYSFKTLCKEVKDDLVDYILANIGLEITIIDYLGASLNVYISNDVLEVITLQDGKSYDVKVQMIYVG